MSEPRKIILTEDDFGPTPAPPTAAAPPPAAARPAGPLPPVTRQAPTSVGANRSGPALLYDERFAGLIPAAAGMTLAWVVTEVLPIQEIEATTSAGADAAVGLWMAIISAILASVVIGFDRALAGAWDEAFRRAGRIVLPALGVGFVAGFVGNAIWITIVVRIVDSGPIGDHDIRFYVARALTWMLMGGGIGVVIGIAERSRAKAINAILGGLAGGAIGGLVFQFSAAILDAGGLSRLVGLLAIGLLIAAAVRLVEQTRREAWLRVISGGMSGKEFILYHDVTRIGSAPESDIFIVKDPRIAPHHARIETRASERVLHSTAGSPVFVNGRPIAAHRLRSGDEITIGNSTLAYAERSLAPVPSQKEASWT